MRTHLRRIPLPLALLLAVAAVLSFSWSLATAPLQGPDEAEHLGTAQYLALSHAFQSPTEERGGAFGLDENLLLDSGFLSIRQNKLARGPWGAAAEARFKALEQQLPGNAGGAGGGPSPTAKNPPLYYLYLSPGLAITPGGIRAHAQVARWLSGLLLLALVTFTWLAAGEAFGPATPRTRLLQTFAAGFAATQPMTGFISGLANTDVLLATIWAAFLWQGLKLVRLGLTPGRVALLSLLTVCSILTHGRGLPLLGVLPLVVLIAWVKQRRGLRASLQAAAAGLGVLAGGFLLYKVTSSTGSLYAGEANLGNKSAFSIRQFLSSVWQYYLPRLDTMEPRIGPGIGYRQLYVQQYFAGVFASYDVYFRYWVYDTVQVLFAGAGLALWSVGMRHWETVKRNWAPIGVVLLTAGALIAFLHLASYRALVNGGDNPLITGRYLLPLTPVLGLGLAALVAGLGRRAGAIVGAAALSITLLLSIGGIAISVERFYA